MKDKDFYYIMTAADSGREAMDATLASFAVITACVEGAKEKGVIYGTGVYEKTVEGSPYLKQAYEMGQAV